MKFIKRKILLSGFSCFINKKKQLFHCIFIVVHNTFESRLIVVYFLRFDDFAEARQRSLVMPRAQIEALARTSRVKPHIYRSFESVFLAPNNPKLSFLK